MGLILSLFFILFLFNIFERGDVAFGNDFHIQKMYHEPRFLIDNDIVEIARLSDMNRFNKILSHILVPRVVGTESHKTVREYIVNEMKGLGWSVEIEESNQKTPLGPLTFRNIIARLNPDASRFLVLSCHYDSKHMRENEFLGATDSAAPCAMMIDLAHALNTRLESFKSKELSLMLLFFDGEEAFVSWGPNDSIYGARSLAAKWEKTKYPKDISDTCHLDRMDLLVLLDLLGAPSPRFYSYFKKTNKWYLQMVSAEKRLTNLQLLDKQSGDNYFTKMHLNAHIEDDHIPFILRDVSVLHVIPTPFPDVWHDLSDNHNALDMSTIDNLNKILRVFTMEYLQGSPRVTRSVDPVYEDL